MQKLPRLNIHPPRFYHAIHDNIINAFVPPNRLYFLSKSCESHPLHSSSSFSHCSSPNKLQPRSSLSSEQGKSSWWLPWTAIRMGEHPSSLLRSIKKVIKFLLACWILRSTSSREAQMVVWLHGRSSSSIFLEKLHWRPPGPLAPILKAF